MQEIAGFAFLSQLPLLCRYFRLADESRKPFSAHSHVLQKPLYTRSPHKTKMPQILSPSQQKLTIETQLKPIIKIQLSVSNISKC